MCIEMNGKKVYVNPFIASDALPNYPSHAEAVKGCEVVD